MNKIEIYSDWCYMDALDNVPLKNGEELKVKWGDGTESKHTVITESYTTHYSGHGGGDDIETRKAFIDVDHKGSKARLRLYGADILCERCK